MLGLGLWTTAIILVSHYSFNVPVCATVLRCPTRNIQSILDDSKTHEVSVIFYYVEYCGENRASKAIFDEVAHYYYQHVFFATVNCWHLQCNCSGTFSTHPKAPHKWPTLTAHVGQTITLAYTGEWNFRELTRFIRTLLRPVERVNTKDELETIVGRSNSIVLGLFPQLDNIKYRQFVAAAIKFREIDPRNAFRFAAAVGSRSNSVISENYGAESQLVLISNRTIRAFSGDNTWTSTKIVWYVKNIFYETFDFIYEYDDPSKVSSQMQIGPVLVLMTTENELLNKFIKLTKDVQLHPGVNYFCHSCHNSEYRKAPHKHLKLLVDKCKRNNAINVNNLSDYFEIDAHLNALFDGFKYLEEEIRIKWRDDHTSTMLYQQHQNIKAVDDDAVNVKASIAKFIHHSIQKFLNSTSTNYTISLVLLDRDRFKDFGHLFGDVFSQQRTEAPQVFIVDQRAESIYSMTDRFGPETLFSFVRNFIQNNVASSRYRLESVGVQLPPQKNGVHLQEVNRHEFMKHINSVNTTVILFYSPQCVFSAMMSHTLLQLTVMLNATNVNFVRVNVQSNDLPWQFVMTETPILMVIPRGHPSDTRVFPRHSKANVFNIFAFIAAQLDPVDQVKLILHGCKQLSSLDRWRKCLHNVSALVMQYINHQLKNWKIFVNERDAILETLKEFKDISMAVEKNYNF